MSNPALLSREDLGYGPIVEFLDRHRGDARTALDVGTGYGIYARYLASCGLTVLGVDVEPAYIETARSRAAVLGLRHLRFEVGNVLTMPLGADWDLVVMSEVIEHLPDDRGMVRRLYEVLRPGGTLVLTAPRADAPLHRWRLMLAGRDRVDEDKGHLRRYSERRLAALLTEAGFVVVDVQSDLGLIVDALHNARLGLALLRRVQRVRTALRIVRLADRLSQALDGPGDLMVAARKPVST
jgi:SAM-dependent methyltransferase